MRWKWGALQKGLLVVALVAGACGGGDSVGDSVAGTYNCGIEGQSTREVWELQEDGALIVTPQEAEPEQGTWSMENDRVIINFSGANNDPFTVEGDRLVFAGPPGPEGTWVCTRA